MYICFSYFDENSIINRLDQWSPNFSSRGPYRDFLDLLGPKLETKKNKGLHFDSISHFTNFLPKS